MSTFVDDLLKGTNDRLGDYKDDKNVYDKIISESYDIAMSVYKKLQNRYNNTDMYANLYDIVMECYTDMIVSDGFWNFKEKNGSTFAGFVATIIKNKVIDYYNKYNKADKGLMKESDFEAFGKEKGMEEGEMAGGFENFISKADESEHYGKMDIDIESLDRNEMNLLRKYERGEIGITDIFNMENKDLIFKIIGQMPSSQRYNLQNYYWNDKELYGKGEGFRRSTMGEEMRSVLDYALARGVAHKGREKANVNDSLYFEENVREYAELLLDDMLNGTYIE